MSARATYEKAQDVNAALNLILRVRKIRRVHEWFEAKADATGGVLRRVERINDKIDDLRQDVRVLQDAVRRRGSFERQRKGREWRLVF